MATVYTIFTLVVCGTIAVQAQSSCSIYCTNCSGNSCLSCSDGHYPIGKGCVQCSSVNCRTCDTGGVCTSCKSGFFGLTCSNDCGPGCINDTCVMNTGECQCLDNFYSLFCHACSDKCQDVCDKTSGLCRCPPGLYGVNCNISCWSKCAVCTNSTSCAVCPTGKYGATCNMNCNTICSDGSCDIYTGHCKKSCPVNCQICVDENNCTNCVNGYYGTKCEQSCSNNCELGCYLNTGLCHSCRIGWYGNGCNMSCAIECRNGCEKGSGKCKECYLGFYGESCRLTCNQECKGECVTENGSCKECYPGRYGPYCEHTCPPNSTCDITCPTTCLSGADGSVCSNNHECLHGCVKDYYGGTCENQCPNKCVPVVTGSRCSANGTCVGGCTGGYSGDKCDTEKNPVDKGDAGASLEKKDGPSSVPVIAGAVGGVVGLVVICVLVVVLIWRKRQRKDTPEQSARSDENQTATTNEYQTIGTLPERSIDVGPAQILVANPNYGRSEEVLALRRTGDSLQFESDTDVEVLEIDEDERRTQARHQERPKSPAQQEENVYYIGLQDIHKRKIAVDEIADFVASKPFQYFVEEFDKFPYGLTRPHNEARKPDNVAKNRYQGIYAYDDTRVKVKGGKADYINANFIDGFLKRNVYIASLGPMKKQMGDFGIFWKMIWQQKVEKVVMVTNLDEEGRSKCEKYWPDVEDTKVYGDVLVKGLTEHVYAEYTRRTFKMTNGSSSRTLHHLHFTAWPDKGIPEDVTALIEFRQRVLRVPAKLGGPTLVHCSAGIGRTGTYIALDILIHEGEAEGAVEIPGCVLNMRRNRVNMIQTAEQYEFLHRALVHALTFDCAPVTVDQLETYISKTGQEQREKQFNQLMSISQHVVPEEQINIARNKSFKNKNRPGADIPGDEYRPRLQVRSGAGDYINAVYIDSFKTKRHYIAAQSPLPGTVVDFLSLVYKEDCPCIVSFEHTQKSKDVGMYYPADNQVLSAGDFTVSSFKMDEQMDNCVLRRLILENKKNEGQKKTVTHITYGDWEQDRSDPNYAANFIQFIHSVENLATEGINNGPVVLHCLDGAKMCGLFSVVSILQQKIAIDHEVSVVNAVRKVKARRHGAISTQEQFDFCHECVLQYIRFFGIYSNVALS